VSDTHVVFNSNEETTQSDGTVVYGALYVYPFENIKRLRGLAIETLSSEALYDIAQQYGYAETLDNYSGLQGKIKALTYLLLDPIKIVNGGYDIEKYVADPEPDLADDLPHWSGSSPRYEWSEYIENIDAPVSLLLTWNGSVVYSEDVSIEEVPTQVTGTDGRIYLRGDQRGVYGVDDLSKYYSIIRQGE
jgi:hypothetical protein